MTLGLAKIKQDASLDWLLPRVSTAVANGIGLTNMIRELRMSEDKGITLQPVSITIALDEAVQLAEQRLLDKKLTITRNAAEASVSAERSALINSVIGNILSNAVKFSQPGTAIDITGRTEGGTYHLAIRDHGIGMPAKIRNHLFDFTKSHSRKGTAGEKGTGFGMPLMRKFVLLFGGAVEVVSRDIAEHPADHGTEFRITLPLAS